MNEASDLLTVKDVAKKLKVTPQYVRKLITEKKIDATRVGKQWLFEIDNVNNFIKDNNFCIEPDDHERLTDDIPEIVALSFFSGAMGLDIGMRNGGINAILACEFNKYCRMTINENVPIWLLLVISINIPQMKSSKWPEFLPTGKLM